MTLSLCGPPTGCATTAITPTALETLTASIEAADEHLVD